MAGANAREEAPHPNLTEILRSAAVPNIYIKLSGFHYASHVSWGYPYSDTHHIVRQLYEHFGPQRLCWGLRLSSGAIQHDLTSTRLKHSARTARSYQTSTSA